MATARQKVVLAGELGMFMLEQGKILTAKEYRAFSKGPIRWATMKRLYGNWNRTLRFLEQSQPDLWKELQGLTGEPDNALATLKAALEDAAEDKTAEAENEEE